MSDTTLKAKVAEYSEGGASRVRDHVTCRPCRTYMVKAHFVHMIRHPHAPLSLYYATLAVKVASDIWNAVIRGLLKPKVKVAEEELCTTKTFCTVKVL